MYDYDFSNHERANAVYLDAVFITSKYFGGSSACFKRGRLPLLFALNRHSCSWNTITPPDAHIHDSIFGRIVGPVPS